MHPALGMVHATSRPWEHSSNYLLLHLLCNVGITMYAVGVGKAIEEELQEIASEPTDKHLFYAEDFSTMGEISEKLKKGICEGTVIDLEESSYEPLEEQFSTCSSQVLKKVPPWCLGPVMSGNTMLKKGNRREKTGFCVSACSGLGSVINLLTHEHSSSPQKPSRKKH